MVAAARTAELVVDETRVERGSEAARLCGGMLTLRRFQEELLSLYLEARAGRGPLLVELEAPTGAGKTLTLLAPIVAGGPGSMGVYPSRELARDQMESLASLLDRLGCRRRLDEPYVKLYDDVALVLVTSESLDALASRKGYGSRGEALAAVAKAIERGVYEGRRAVVFTVPEYPYLLSSAAYGSFREAGAWLATAAEAVAREAARSASPGALLERVRRELVKLIPRMRAVEELGRFSLLAGSAMFFDEFHAYDEESREALAALVAASVAHYGPLGFIVLSSATPVSELPGLVTELSQGLGLKRRRVTASASAAGDVVRRETLLVLVGLELGVSGAPGFMLAQWEVPRLAPGLLRDAEGRLRGLCGGGWRKAMVFVDRVGLVYEVADQLVAEGVASPEEVACVTSLRGRYRHPSCSAEPREARVVVGNEAISYGIDIPEVDAAVVYARSWAQALQRIGRVGRGKHPMNCPAVAYLVLPGYALSEALRGTGAGARISYDQLASMLQSIYPRLATPSPRPGSLAAARALLYASAALVASEKQAIDTAGSLDEAREARGASLASAAMVFAARGSGVLHDSLVTPEGVYRLYSLRPGLAARICSDGHWAEASLTVLLRNAEFSLDEQRHCLVVEAPASKRYGVLRLTRSGAELHQRLRGTVLSLRLYAERLDPILAQEPSGFSHRLRSLVEQGVVPPEQPVLVAAPPPGEPGEHLAGLYRAAAALGDALLVVNEGGETVGILAPA